MCDERFQRLNVNNETPETKQLNVIIIVIIIIIIMSNKADWNKVTGQNKEESTRQKLIAFLFLVKILCVDLFTSST